MGSLLTRRKHLGKNEVAWFGVPRYFPLSLNSLPHPIFAQHHLEILSALPSRRNPFEYLIVLLGWEVKLPSTLPACCSPQSHLHILTFGSHPPEMTREGTGRNNSLLYSLQSYKDKAQEYRKLR